MSFAMSTAPVGHPRKPHTTSNAAAVIAAATNQMSVRLGTLLRVGSSPMRPTYGADGD